MASKVTNYPDDDGFSFDIIRRDIIGTVRANPYGTQNPVAMAYEIIGADMADDDAPAHYEFTLAGRLYTAEKNLIEPNQYGVK